MNLSAYRKLVRYVDHISERVAIKVVMLILVSATYIIQAVTCAKAVSIVITGEDFEGLVTCLMIVAGAVVLRAGLSGYLEVVNKKLASSVKSEIRVAVLNKLFELGPKYVNDKRSGKVQSILMDGIEYLEPFLINYVPQIISLLITGSVIIGYSIYLDPFTGIIMILVMTLSFIVPYFTMPLVRRSMLEYWGNYSVLNANYIEAIQGITTLKAFNSSKTKREQLTEGSETFYKSQLYNTSFSVMDSGIMIALSTAAANLTVGIAAYRAGAGIIEASTIALFLFLAAEFSRPMMELNGAWHNSFLGLSVIYDLFEIMDEKTDEELADLHGSKKGTSAEHNKNSYSLDEGYPDIVFEDVTFQYPKGKRPALSHVSLTIPSGSTVAIVGQSGSGKSTVANLLCRYYDIQSGSILVGGGDIRDYDPEYLRRQIGVVFQENYLFNGTIAENIAMAKPGADMEEIIRAAKASGADSFIQELPEGYQTIIGERGTDLSGGQRQRIAIARALMKSASIMIFDEATSNVDAANEAYIKEMIDQISANQTTLIIAHRLSTIMNADRIIVLRDGRIAESGTHEELMKANGEYARMVRLQRGE